MIIIQSGALSFGRKFASACFQCPRGTPLQPVKHSKLPLLYAAGVLTFIYDLKQDNPRLPAGRHRSLVPYAGLDFTDMCLAQKQHAQPGLPNPAADGKRQLSS